MKSPSIFRDGGGSSGIVSFWKQLFPNLRPSTDRSWSRLPTGFGETEGPCQGVPKQLWTAKLNLQIRRAGGKLQKQIDLGLRQHIKPEFPLKTIMGDMKRTFILILTASALVAQLNLNAQVYSENIVGYVHVTFNAGVNLFGNPLDNAPNTLSMVLVNQGTEIIPNGTAVSLWNPATDSFGPSSVFNSGSWSADLTLNPGTGAELIAPTTFSTDFLGAVDNPDGTPIVNQSEASNPLLPTVFSGPNGIYLRSDAFPQTVVVGSDIFLNIFGRLPNSGEQVTLLDAATQTYTTDTYLGNGSWDNVPTLNVAEAAFFNLNSVPEPSTVFAGLTALGLVIAARYFR